MKSSDISREEFAERKRQMKYITQNLEAAYGIPLNNHRDDPLDELIGTVLSQSTTNINSRRAFESLKKRFPTWEAARRARPATIAEAIKSGGLANVKSVVIHQILNQIRKEHGTLNLSFLKTISAQEGKQYLTSLKGVGPKTAACVLLFSCKQKVFPMDTHIFRILRRVGLLSDRLNDQDAHLAMEKLIPAGKHYSLHVNLIRHGRLLCRPRDPKCETCTLIDHCEYGRERL
jgi:endonuclease-3